MTDTYPILHPLSGTTILPLFLVIVLGTLFLAVATPGIDGLHILVLVSFIPHLRWVRVMVRPIDMADPFILFPLDVTLTTRPIPLSLLAFRLRLGPPPGVDLLPTIASILIEASVGVPSTTVVPVSLTRHLVRGL